MKPHLAAFGTGAIFAVGLAISGMTKPSKVIGFLDIAGVWDPSLALVMAGAVAVHAIAYRLIRRRPSPIFDAAFHLPTRDGLDAKLVLGAAFFGIGWGLAGFCPGPGLVAAGGGVTGALIFVAGMTLGMLFEHAAARAAADGHHATRRAARADPPPAHGR